ncbi:integrase [Halostagnicola sp. A56]|uniref:site-specific integrase n=1 Tax=Halostagnicola sp. A56 TaxID=1495067 RepID=UPI0004A0D43F|nr:site-specific integrase [Halostagnicola sp. A56]KDE59577.1 integrase [Halostagnicola sp. A56]
MTAHPEQSIKRLRERVNGAEDMSEDDAQALLRMSNRIRILGESKYGDFAHEKYLMRAVKLAQEVGGLADALEDRDAAENLVAWINTEKSNSAETNKDYRVTLRQFGKLASGDDVDGIPDSLEWVPGGYPSNYDPAPDPGDMLRWDEEILPMIDACSNLRDRALIALAWDLGPRPYELFDLTPKQITDHKYGLQVTVNGKTGRRSPVLIPSVPYVQRWLEVHPGDRNDPLFCALNSPREISNNRIRDILKEKARKADVERPVTPSNFRKSSASHLASQGVSQAHLEDHHGWTRGSDIASRYISVFGDANDREIARAHGIDVGEDEHEDLAPVPCPSCDRDNPRDSDVCVWCGRALSQRALDKSDDVNRRWVESAGEASGEQGDVSLDDVMEARDLVDENPALKRLLFGDD